MQFPKYASFFCPDEELLSASFSSMKMSEYDMLYAAYSQTGKTSIDSAISNAKNSKPVMIDLENKYQLLDFKTLGSVCAQYPVPAGDEIHTIEDVIFLIGIILLIISNSVICYILTQKHMRTPTNFILLIIAISELLTGLFPLPLYLARTIKNRSMWWRSPELDNNWHNSTSSLPVISRTFKPTCSQYFVSLMIWLMKSHIPTLAHAASIWLTVSLAAQRLIYITWPALAPRWCSVKSSKIACLISWIIVFLVNSPLFTTQFIMMKPIVYLPNAMTKNSEIMKEFNCSRTLEELYLSLESTIDQVMKCNNNENLMNSYLIMRFLFIHGIPCTLLIILTAFLLLGMRRMSKRRQRLFSDGRAMAKQVELRRTSNQTTMNENKANIQLCNTDVNQRKPLAGLFRGGKSPNVTGGNFSVNTNPSTSNPHSTSKMLLVILFIFLTVQLANAAYMTFYFIIRNSEVHEEGVPDNKTNTTKKVITSTWSSSVMEYGRITCNFMVLLSYLANFFIYWTMSVQFRSTLYVMFGKSNNSGCPAISSRRISRPDLPSSNAANHNARLSVDGVKSARNSVTIDKNFLHPNDRIGTKVSDSGLVSSQPTTPSKVKGYCTVTDL